VVAAAATALAPLAASRWSGSSPAAHLSGGGSVCYRGASTSPTARPPGGGPLAATARDELARFPDRFHWLRFRASLRTKRLREREDARRQQQIAPSIAQVEAVATTASRKMRYDRRERSAPHALSDEFQRAAIETIAEKLGTPRIDR
jgi:hypothetical protein